ncbi:DUF4304 domain-containing protein [Novosphingobium sp. BW1]|uniref:DUF4304 domain-containing protein n=1 Tax=Novosphingobium sp. BW1 TaxID=2592621 RepID=UPI0011DE8289|nr:DUF4304 domain-containing protein [Novosphingobium sp. BW1]TYC79096.1 hypothetical protein FMM79_20470 [Novosphingobium sp. BW1]
MAGPHDKIIAHAARSELAPLGFQRKGQSRTWTADHSWWVTVVEFQPSSWSKGSYLNVAAHWLWSGLDHISFDFGGRLEEHVEFASEMQFTEEATRLAQGAKQEALRLSNLFVSPSATAEILLSEVRKTNSHAWMAYHAGVMAGVAGLSADANEMFVRVSSGFAQPDSALAQAAKHMAALVEEPERFRDEANSLIAMHRASLRLPTLPIGPF